MDAYLIGWSHTAFGKLADDTLESLIVRAVQEAVSAARVDYEAIDEIVVGNFNSGFVPQGFPASLALQANPALQYKPATRVENACATGSAAILQGIRCIQSGAARLVLVVGAEKMTSAPPAEINRGLISASYVAEEAEAGSFAGLFGQIANNYFQRFGNQSDALARIAAKNHRNGAANSLAHMQKDLGYEFCRTVNDKNPLVAGPLRRTDCSTVSDGAAALIIAGSEIARQADKAVRIRSMVQVNDFLPMTRRDMTRLEGCSRAWRLALDGAGVQLTDLSFVETHDCFTIAELMEYEAMGLAGPGEGARVVFDGLTEPGGRLPVNLSGGLKAKGHPIGATGVSMHVMAAMQLTGEYTGIKARDPRLAGVFNMGGSGVANYVSILESAG
ncbi:acetyl-CoA acetyltransferase [Bradyrhizobium sp. KB893862 SZCCT0404]|uniref:acetyl-CoA acetyltransferase n=1 Tax=Bradyrhizobium sp. KB893862 SZCCT0404 TaxID=2807672 RepID=UPI001BAD3EE9|nr:acetyl-CoA acetyltransferase [Bradyrhizobium sp. KB893862 SZCCT0404]MBR1175290.1 acetyl-CoA acetyltransferase [Bradyrhizobium sp. KB893862 SZCCT0404]